MADRYDKAKLARARTVHWLASYEAVQMDVRGVTLCGQRISAAMGDKFIKPNAPAKYSVWCSRCRAVRKEQDAEAEKQKQKELAGLCPHGSNSDDCPDCRH
ncbi:MAG TPA: hypothetical protein VHJ19_13295 [Gammaproteobacteria bacterium]|nr:hypothetical protein [Gammaproteobacteria bacterium]